MTTVWVLIAIVVNRPFVGPIQVDADSVPFKNAADCLNYIPVVEKQLEGKWSQYYTKCVEKKIR